MNLLSVNSKNNHLFYILSLAIPLILSAFTHLWNPVGFPSIRTDEGIYLERAIRVLEGLGPQVPIKDFGRPYDHPYFAQIFLAGIFKLIGYPDSFNQKPQDIHYIEMLYFVPRVLMGLLAIVDTFLIYKIAERRYQRRVAFAASILFAVMPLTWLTRRIYLDPIQLPFLLSSILFAVYYNKLKVSQNENNKGNKKILLIIFSGLFMGLAIFTKIPAITMIPLVGYLIFSSRNNRNLKALGLWLIPVILIPAIWPAYATYVGQFDNWLSDVLWQTSREGAITDTFYSILTMDPVLVIVGLVGSFYAILIKRDLFLLFWIIPFVIFFYFIGRIAITFWVPLLPAFCIAGGIIIEGLIKRLDHKKESINLQSKISDNSAEYKNSEKKSAGSVLNTSMLVFTAVLATVIIFGLVSTTMLITTNLNSSYLELYRIIISHLSDAKDSNNNNNKVLMIADAKLRGFSWAPKFMLYKKNINLDFIASPLKENLTDEKILLLVDKGDLNNYILSDHKKYVQHKSVYNNTDHLIDFNEKIISSFDRDKYPYTNMIENRGIGKVELRANY